MTQRPVWSLRPTPTRDADGAGAGARARVPLSELARADPGGDAGAPRAQGHRCARRGAVDPGARRAGLPGRRPVRSPVRPGQARTRGMGRRSDQAGPGHPRCRRRGGRGGARRARAGFGGARSNGPWPCCAGASLRRRGSAGSATVRSACCCARATTQSMRSTRLPPTHAPRTSESPTPHPDAAVAAEGARRMCVWPRSCVVAPAVRRYYDPVSERRAHGPQRTPANFVYLGFRTQCRRQTPSGRLVHSDKTQNPPGSRLLKAGTKRRAGIRSCSRARADRSLQKPKL